METRGVASVDSDAISESSGHELAVIASRDAVARLWGCLHLVRDGVRGLVNAPLDSDQGLSVEKKLQVKEGRAMGWCGCLGCAGKAHTNKGRS